MNLMLNIGETVICNYLSQFRIKSCNKIPYTEYLKQQTSISYSFKGWEVLDQGDGRSDVF